MNIFSNTKPFFKKAYLLVILIIFVASIPNKADASFLNTVTSFIFGNGAQASEAYSEKMNEDDFGTDNFIPNSQNMPLLESSINSDTKNINTETSIATIEGGALMANSGLIGGMGIENVSSGEMTTYIVEEGDTLSEIAEEFDVSLNTIRWENNLTGQNIKVGQKLNILPVTGVKHIVKSGDTISKIADKYDGDAEEILIFNGMLNSSKLKQGDIVYVPNGIIKAVKIVSKSNSVSKTTTSGTSNSRVAQSGYYVRPTTGRITSPYGPRKGSFHYGIDIGNARGTPIVAAASGVVGKVVNYCVEGKTSCGGRYGNYIIIIHANGTQTIYSHLAKVSVFTGQSVSQGEQIGKIGNTGRSTGPHLHFEIENANGSKMRPPF